MVMLLDHKSVVGAEFEHVVDANGIYYGTAKILIGGVGI